MLLLSPLGASIILAARCFALEHPAVQGLGVTQTRHENHGIERRQAQSGNRCGPSGGNVACAAGLCCSQDGVCGLGTPFCGAPGCQLSFGPACDGNKQPTGQDTSAIPRPQFGSVPYGIDISHCTVMGKVALTFDDGPYIYTNELLSLLQTNNVKATFFVVGANGGKGQIQDAGTGYPTIIQRMYSDGHQIGSHTWSHQDLSVATPQQRRDQIIRNEIALADILGFFPTYLRPPYTRWTPDVLNDLKSFGYHVTNYDIDTRDWQGDYTYAQNLYTTILSQHSPTSSSWIALSHDVDDRTVNGFVQYMIDQARKLNYQLVTLGECLGDPPTNWYRDPTTGGPVTAGRRPPGQAAAVSGSASTTALPLPAAQSSGSSSVKTTSSVVVTPTPVSQPQFGQGTGGESSTPSVSRPSPTLVTTPGKNLATNPPPRSFGALVVFIGVLMTFLLP